MSEYSYEENVSRNQNLHFKQFSIIADSKGIEFSQNKLQTLNFVNEDNKFNNLALLMSDENPYVVKFAVYDENLNFIVKREFEGSWLWILEQVIEFTKTYNTTSAKIEKGNFARVETQSYPDPSTREIVLNCFAHLDLTQPSNIKIEFYKDKCVITSPGALYKNSIEDILKGKQSFRNKNLVKLLDKFDYIENYAKGIERTIKAYDKYDVKPTFDADSEYFFTVTLPNVNYYINLKNGIINGTLNGIINDTLNDLEKKVVQLILEDKNITIKSLVEKTNKSPRTINRILLELKEKNILQRVGSRKDGYWKINQ